jgi:hypothetical protein
MGDKMSTEVEEGVYAFRVKFTTKEGELEVNYELHRVYNYEDVKTIRERLTEFYSQYANGKIDITHKFEKRIIDDEPFYID